MRAAQFFGFELVRASKHNSKLEKAGCRPFTIPSHNGLKDEIGDQYIVSFCRQYGIDRAEFKKKL